MSAVARLEALAAAPKPWLIKTHYADGSVRELRQPREGMAINFAKARSAYIGRDLIERETGKTVRIVNVTVEHSPE